MLVCLFPMTWLHQPMLFSKFIKFISVGLSMEEISREDITQVSNYS